MDESLEICMFPKLITGSIMTGDQHDLFIKFLILNLRSSRELNFNIHMILVDFLEPLHNMEIVEQFGVEFVTY